ncbi:MAG: hypothetical protein F6K47_21525 [Symploca sp. SIO2E6]|nr:hypothetical protein [Symploca sp. SIO2E6]
MSTYIPQGHPGISHKGARFFSKTMKVRVLSIKPIQELNSHEVLLSIDEDRQIFKFTTEVNQVGGRQLQTTQGEQRFSDCFRFNQRVAMNISKLVVKFYNKEAVELPADVGILSLQKKLHPN